MIGQERSFERERETVYREKSDLKANESDIIGQFGRVRISQVTFIRGSTLFIEKGLGL